jgi:Tfp pilus assembly protein PilF
MKKLILNLRFCLTTIILLVLSLNSFAETDSTDYLYNQGKQEFEARKYSNAWRYFDKAAKLSPDNIAIQKSIADVCIIMNKPAPAINALENVHKLQPANKEILWKLTQLYFNYGNAQKTIELGEIVKKQMPEEKEVDFMLGKSYYLVNNYGKAQASLQNCLKNNPDHSEANYLMGHMLIKMSQYKESKSYYEKFLVLEPKRADVAYEYAMVLATAEEFDASVAWFKKALDRGYPARDDFFTNMAYTYADAGKTDEAVSMLRKILARRPQDLAIIGAIADMSYQAGDYKQAIDYWDQMLGYNDKDARSLYMIGRSYIQMGKEKEGRQLCDQAIQMDPSLASLRMQKGLF